MTPQTAPSGEPLLKTWKHKVTLRGHLDALQALTFHPAEPLLLSAAADHTLKLWNLHKTTPTKKYTHTHTHTHTHTLKVSV